MMDFVAFDLEIANPLPEDGDAFVKPKALGISCAATLRSGDCDPLLWYAGSPFSSMGTEPYQEKLSSEESGMVAEYLVAQQQMGFQVVTWNGAGFDFRVLRDECPAYTHDAVAELALNHIDIAFHMLCVKGYMIGLNAAAMGMGVETKTEGMRGDLAPVMWREGRESQDKVLEYVAQDARVTMAVAQALEEKGYIRWTSRSGNLQTWYAKKLLTVREASELPLPYTAWMSKPWLRGDCIDWIGE